MKIIRQSNEGSLPLFQKIWLIMKLNFFLILLTVLQVSAGVSAQNTRLDLKMKDATISQVFDEIERQTELMRTKPLVLTFGTNPSMIF